MVQLCLPDQSDMEPRSQHAERQISVHDVRTAPLIIALVIMWFNNSNMLNDLSAE